MTQPLISVIVRAHNEEEYVDKCLPCLIRALDSFTPQRERCSPVKNLPIITMGMPTYNCAWSLVSVLNAIAKLDYPKDRIRIVVVDNNSEDETARILKDFQQRFGSDYESVIIISEKSNIPEARNICVSNSIGEYVLFIDSDVLAPPDTISTMLETFASNPRVRITSFLCLTDSMGFLKEIIFAKQPNVPYATDLIMMGCTMVKRQLFNEIGLFDPKYSSGEDVNLAARASKAGYLVILDPAQRPVHLTEEKPHGTLQLIIGSCITLFKDTAYCHFMILQECKPRWMIERLIFYLAMTASILLFIAGVVTGSILLSFPLIGCYGVAFAYHFTKASGKWRLINPVLFPLFGMSLALGILKEIVRHHLLKGLRCSTFIV